LTNRWLEQLAFHRNPRISPLTRPPPVSGNTAGLWPNYLTPDWAHYTQRHEGSLPFWASERWIGERVVAQIRDKKVAGKPKRDMRNARAGCLRTVIEKKYGKRKTEMPV